MHRPSGRVVLAGLGRFFGVLAVCSLVACSGGILFGAITHEIRHGIAAGFYVTGSLLAGCGVLMAIRPPVRGRSESGLSSAIGAFGGLVSPGGVRWATRDEHRDAMNVPAVFITVGVTLVVIGAFVDVPH